jgi:VWFA-related protein
MNTLLAALVNGAIMSAIVTAIAGGALEIIPRRILNAATRHIVWWAAMAVAVALPLWRLPSPFALRSRQGLAVPMTPAVARPITGIGGSAPHVDTAGVPARARVRFPIAIEARRWPQWLVAIWSAITALMLLRLMLSCVLLGRRKGRASPAGEQALVKRWQELCGSSRPVRLAACSEILTPMVAGLARPAILMPTLLLAELDESELDQIGLHETAHVARHDDYALIVERVLEALFCFHPVVRWIARRIDLEREIACDDFVVAATGSARPYARCLTRVLELTGGVRSSLVAAAAADERSDLTRRVDMLLDKTRHTGTRLLPARLATLFTVMATLAFFAARAPGLIAFAQPAAAVAVVEQPPAPMPTPAAQAARPAENSAPSPDQPPKPQANPAPTSLTVVVQDPMRRLVTGLERQNFRLFQDGAEQEISRLATTDGPVSVGLVLDTSGSMRGKFANVEQAVLQFVRMSNPQDEFFVVQFNQEAQLAGGFTRDAGEIQSRLDQVIPQGGAAMWDAVAMAVQQLKRARNSQQALVVITDTGGDNSSSRSYRELVALLTETNASVYTISIADPSAVNPPFAEFSKRVGGQHIFAVQDELATVMSRIGVELRNRYVIEYTPRNMPHDGAFHRLQVNVVTPPGMPPLSVSASTGYYAPRQ